MFKELIYAKKKKKKANKNTGGHHVPKYLPLYNS